MSKPYEGDKHTSQNLQGKTSNQPLGTMSNDPNVQAYQSKDMKGQSGCTMSHEHTSTCSPSQQWQQGKQGLYGQTGTQGVYGQQGAYGQLPPVQLHTLYTFPTLSIDVNAMRVFKKHDKKGNWVMTLSEIRPAVVDFCKMNNQPEPTDQDFQCLFQIFDFDHSGLIDFGEFRLMLETMRGSACCSPQQISEFRTNRPARLAEYKTIPL